MKPLWPPCKRAADVMAALLAAPLWLPLLGAAALLVRVSLGRPVFFRQVRTGRGGRPFTILKLRTMREGEGTDAERLTRVGRLLRATSLDELPQFLNVLRGEMSIVGPRPLLPEYLPRYSPEQARRHEVRPGITGWAQVHGRNAVSWERKFELDVWYVDHLSAWTDLRVVALTFAALFTRKGVSADGEATVGPFLGS